MVNKIISIVIVVCTFAIMGYTIHYFRNLKETIYEERAKYNYLIYQGRSSFLTNKISQNNNCINFIDNYSNTVTLCGEFRIIQQKRSK